ncbi:MAG: DUF3800 domain-containing protein [Armatimonadetes bacterium]|nr:DUF3800 domain-containing protein [Armatimonadota bacterium]
MYLVFLDESGSAYVNYDSFKRGYEARHKDLPPAKCPAEYFVLSGIGIHERHMPMVDEWFAGVKRDFLQNPTASAGEEYEIKGEILYALRQGQTPGAWEGSRVPKRKRKFLDAQQNLWTSLSPHELGKLEKSIFDLLGRLSPVVWAIVINQRDHFRKHRANAWAPLHIAMTYLQQRVLHYVQAVHGVYERAMFVMDETSKLSTASQFDDYLAMRNVINHTAAWPVDFKRYLVDVPVFGKSHLHESLQLADIITYAVRRHVFAHDPLEWFAKIEPLFQVHWRTGTYTSCGLSYIP